MANVLFVALVAALVNTVLTLVLPCAFKNTNLPFITRLRDAFASNRDVLVTSNLVVGVVVFITLHVSQTVRLSVPTGVGNFVDSVEDIFVK